MFNLPQMERSTILVSCSPTSLSIFQQVCESNLSQERTRAGGKMGNSPRLE